MFVPATKTVRTATTRAGPSSGTIPPPVLAVVLVRELRLAASQAQPQSVKGDQPSMTTRLRLRRLVSTAPVKTKMMFPLVARALGAPSRRAASPRRIPVVMSQTTTPVRPRCALSRRRPLLIQSRTGAWAREVVSKTPGSRKQYVPWQVNSKRKGHRHKHRGHRRDDASSHTSSTSTSHHSRKANGTLARGSSGLHSFSRLVAAPVGVEEYIRQACNCELEIASEASRESKTDAAPSPPGDNSMSAFSAATAPAQLYQLDHGDYNGHNIAAIAVDSKSGRIIGCQWNHCHLMKSTAAHAEERLIDRLFATADLCGLDHSVKYNKVRGNPHTAPVWRPDTLSCLTLQFLKDVVIYTSLEPCCTRPRHVIVMRYRLHMEHDTQINALAR